MKITVKFLTPENSQEFQADAVFIPGAHGAFEILPGHAAIISALAEGVVRWRNDGEESSSKVSGGIIRLKDNYLEICAQV